MHSANYSPAQGMIRRAKLLVALVTTLLVSSCGHPFWLPAAHKIEIQQGNLVSQSQVDQLQVGMSREEVLARVGQPVQESTFRENRWDYVYTKGPAGNAIKARYLYVYFDNDRVTQLDNNYAEQSGEIIEKKSWWRRLLRLG